MRIQRKGAVAWLAAALVLAATAVVLSAPAAVAGPPSCAVSNARNHKDYDSLQQAVDAAKAGDTLEVKGTCVGSTTVDRDVTVKGITNRAFPGPPTLDGNAEGTVLSINGGTTTMRNLTITGGHTTGLGGGIYVATAAVLVDVLVTGNTTSANQIGGGIEADLGSSLTLIDSTVSGNTAGSSGGIDMFRAKATLINSTVTGNHATRAPSPDPDGCGFGDPVIVYSCAGGIWNYQGTLALVDSTVSGNTAAYRGGGVASYVRFFADGTTPRSGLTILSGTTSITSNSAADRGGGIWANTTVSSTSIGVRAADGTSTYTDPISGSTLPAWTGSVSGNTPDQCSPTLTFGGTTCGA